MLQPSMKRVGVTEIEYDWSHETDAVSIDDFFWIFQGFLWIMVEVADINMHKASIIYCYSSVPKCREIVYIMPFVLHRIKNYMNGPSHFRSSMMVHTATGS